MIVVQVMYYAQFMRWAFLFYHITIRSNTESF